MSNAIIRLYAASGHQEGRGMNGHRAKHLQNCRRVLSAIEQLDRERPDYWPSRREIAARAGVPLATTQAALTTLRDEYGYVWFAEHRERNVRLVAPTY